MNYDKLLDILDDMYHAAILPHSELYIDATKEELSEALKQLRELIERDTPKKVSDTRYEYDGRGEMIVIARCPACDDDIFNDALFCECGQRLDWSEK